MKSKELIKEIDKYTKMLKESYVFNDDISEEENFPLKNEMIEDNENTSDDRINQIRQIALNGIQEFVQNVNSPQYDFYKKVWAMCDKQLNEKNKQSKIE